MTRTVRVYATDHSLYRERIAELERQLRLAYAQVNRLFGETCHLQTSRRAWVNTAVNLDGQLERDRAFRKAVWPVTH